MAENIIKQGAEGRLYCGEYNGQPCLIKERFKKAYRHPELDAQITRQRMKAETKAITRCENIGILVPKVYHMDLNDRKIYMQYFDKAITVKTFIIETIAGNGNEAAKPILEKLCERIGAIIGKMHSNNIIHGDLTTSNILVNGSKEDGSYDEYELIFIDFGLSCYSNTSEDKSVDLYVLERAITSTHSQQDYLFKNILTSYWRECGKESQAISLKFEEVRARGRKRTMVG